MRKINVHFIEEQAFVIVIATTDDGEENIKHITCLYVYSKQDDNTFDLNQ